MSNEVVSPPLSAIGKTLGVFRHRPFLLFWTGTFISNIGNWTENAAQSWAVTSQTVGNPVRVRNGGVQVPRPQIWPKGWAHSCGHEDVEWP